MGLSYVQGSAPFTLAAPLQAVGCVTQAAFPLSLRRQRPSRHGLGKFFQRNQEVCAGVDSG